jgi:hypothetical protein
MRLAFVATMVVGVAVAPAAFADTRYAAPGGVGAGASCSQDDPCSLRFAVSDTWADDGDTVLLAPGEYDLGGAAGSQLSIVNAIDLRPAVPGTRPRILNDGASAFWVQANATISGLHVEATGLSDSTGVVHIQNGARARLERMIISSPALAGSQAIAAYTGGVELVDSAVYVAGANARGIDFFGAPLDSGIVNSTVVATGAGATGVWIPIPFPGQPAYDVQLRNTIASGTGSALVAFHGVPGDGADLVTIDLAYSNVSSIDDDPGDDAVVNLGAGMQSQPPLLADPAAGDFAQLPDSPTIDAGLADPLSGSLDLPGGPRVSGAAIDIGADEFDAPPDTTAPDTTAPQTTITKGPKAKQKTKRKRAKAKFEFISSEPGSSFECKLDKRAWQPCASPLKVKVKAKYKGKKHVLRVRATDSAGNTDKTGAAHAWKLKRKR